MKNQTTKRILAVLLALVLTLGLLPTSAFARKAEGELQLEAPVETPAERPSDGGGKAELAASRTVSIKQTYGSTRRKSAGSKSITLDYLYRHKMLSPTSYATTPSGYTFSHYLVSCGGTGGVGAAGSQTMLGVGDYWNNVSGTCEIEIVYTGGSGTGGGTGSGNTSTSSSGLLTGEGFTIKVYRAYDNGTVISSTTVNGTCKDSAGHSGYNHSMNLSDVVSAAGFSGYNNVLVKRYDYWDSDTQVTVGSSYVSPSNYGKISVHYNITGSSAFKADESVWLISSVPNTAYTITYNANGGSGAPGATQTASNTSTTKSGKLSSTKPANGNRPFLGWSTDPNATSATYAAGGTYNFTGNTNLYAVWGEAVTKLNLMVLKKLTNATFGDLDDEFSIEIIDTNSSSSESVYLTKDNAVAGMSDASASAAWQFEVTSGHTLCIFENNATVNGEDPVFAGTHGSLTVTDEGGGMLSITIPAGVTAASPLTLTNTYPDTQQVTVTYNGNGHTEGTPPTADKVDKGANLTIPNNNNRTMLRNGYEFKGWSTDPDATTPDYTAGSVHTFSADTTLYAVWEPQATNCATVTKKFVGLTLDEIPTDFSITWKVTHVATGTTETKVLSPDDAMFNEDTMTYKWEKACPFYYTGDSADKTNVEVTESCDVQGYTYTAKSTISWTVDGHTLTRTGIGGNTQPACNITNTYTPDTPEPVEADYTIQWLDADTGNVLKSKNREGTVGDTVSVLEEDKVLAATFGNYAFDEDNANNVLSDTLAESGTVLKLYFQKQSVATWYDWDGETPLEQKNFPKGGTVPSYPGEDPERAADDDYTYEFSGWDRENQENGDVDFTAVYTRTPKNPLTFTKTATGTGTKEIDDVTYPTAKTGETVTYTITVGNPRSKAVTATVTDTLPEGLDFVSATEGYTMASRTLTWTGVTVPAASNGVNGTAVLTITATVTVDRQLIAANVATLTTADDPATSATSQPIGVPTFGIHITKFITSVTHDGESAAPTANTKVYNGDAIDYEVKVTNISSESLWNMRVEDAMDQTLSMVTPSQVSPSEEDLDGREWLWLGKNTRTSRTDKKTDQEVPTTTYYWRLKGEFKPNETITLTYSSNVQYLDKDGTTILNTAKATGYHKDYDPDQPASLLSVDPYRATLFDAESEDDKEFDPEDDEYDKAGSNSSSSSSTPGTIPGSTEPGIKVEPTITVTWLYDGEQIKQETIGKDESYEDLYPDPEEENLPAGDWENPVTDQETGNVTIQWKHDHNFQPKTDSNGHHVWATGKEPTCTVDGTKIYECACGKTEEREVLNSKMGHHLVPDAAVQPTCTRTGLTAGSHCDRVGCGHVEVAQTTVPALEHTFPANWSDKCSDDSTDCTGHEKVCTRCSGGENGGIQTEGHDFPDTWTTRTAATIEADGEEYRVCADCDHEETRPIPKIGSVRVTWMNGHENNRIVKSVTVAQGSDYSSQTPAAPAAPDANHEFDGWGIPVVGSDGITITAKWKPILVNVEWYDGINNNEPIQTKDDWEKGKDVTENDHPAVPTAPEGKEFDGWKVEVDPETGDIKVTAQWKNKTPDPDDRKELVVKWVSEDGQAVLDSKTFREGEEEPAKTIDDPTKAPDANNTYTFDKWVKSVDDQGNITYRATFKSTPKNNGGGNGGGNGGNTTPINPPEEDLDDPDVPLADLPMLNQADHFAYIIGKPDGSIQPLANITRAEVVTIFFRIMTEEARTANWGETNDFSDVSEGMWYNHAVCTAVNAGLIKGMPDGTFAGSRNITRAEFATIAARFLDAASQSAEEFDDISGHWAEADINRATAAGWIKGVGNGKFNPDAYITRAEVMTLVNRMLNRQYDEDHALTDMIVWPDNEDKGIWYYGDVQEATNDHEYDRKAGTLAETWTKITQPRDWSELEK